MAGGNCCHLTQELSRVELRDEDILSILRTLEYDGLVECYLGEDGEAFRLARQTIPQSSPFTSIPCGVCPVRYLVLSQVASSISSQRPPVHLTLFDLPHSPYMRGMNAMCVQQVSERAHGKDTSATVWFPCCLPRPSLRGSSACRSSMIAQTTASFHRRAASTTRSGWSFESPVSAVAAVHRSHI